MAKRKKRRSAAGRKRTAKGRFAKTGRRKSSRRKTGRRKKSRRSGQVPVEILNRRLIKLQRVVEKRRGGKPFICK